MRHSGREAAYGTHSWAVRPWTMSGYLGHTGTDSPDFGRRGTLALGAAFGVITVVGPVGAGSVQVATFRADAGYSDGRHPDRVSYTTAEADEAS